MGLNDILNTTKRLTYPVNLVAGLVDKHLLGDTGYTNLYGTILFGGLSALESVVQNLGDRPVIRLLRTAGAAWFALEALYNLTNTPSSLSFSFPLDLVLAMKLATEAAGDYKSARRNIPTDIADIRTDRKNMIRTRTGDLPKLIEEHDQTIDV
ncbi:hypothetical protein J4430_04155 [Candidatus Woesearchaeota archaeon]|nr:hypothetical protein [Candidatus Woesearchaeota archaeon]